MPFEKIFIKKNNLEEYRGKARMGNVYATMCEEFSDTDTFKTFYSEEYVEELRSCIMQMTAILDNANPNKKISQIMAMNGTKVVLNEARNAYDALTEI